MSRNGGAALQSRLMLRFGALLVLLVASAVQAGPAGRSAPVKVGAALKLMMAPQTWVSGTVISRHEAKLASEVAGNLVEVMEVGSQLQAGDVVARIDATFITLKVKELAEQVQAAQARLRFLKSEVKRNKHLAKQNNAAQIRLDELRADRDVARNELRMAQLRVRQAEEERRRHFIRSPFAGVVAERLMHLGERAAVGDEVLRVVDHHNLEVQARVPLATLNYVAVDDLLTLSLGQKTPAGQKITAPVRALVAVADSRSRLLDLRIRLNDSAWRVGQAVRVRLPTAAAKLRLSVPRDALVLRRDGAFIFRINAENKAERIAVLLGVASGDRVAVSGELQGGDKVVTRGGERLRPGSVVNILNEQH
jgi:RND family efflux transporter MFP subunit